MFVEPMLPMLTPPEIPGVPTKGKVLHSYEIKKIGDNTLRFAVYSGVDFSSFFRKNGLNPSEYIPSFTKALYFESPLMLTRPGSPVTLADLFNVAATVEFKWNTKLLALGAAVLKEVNFLESFAYFQRNGYSKRDSEMEMFSYMSIFASRMFLSQSSSVNFEFNGFGEFVEFAFDTGMYEKWCENSLSYGALQLVSRVPNQEELRPIVKAASKIGSKTFVNARKLALAVMPAFKHGSCQLTPPISSSDLTRSCTGG